MGGAHPEVPLRLPEDAAEFQRFAERRLAEIVARRHEWAKDYEPDRAYLGSNGTRRLRRKRGRGMGKREGAQT